ncbi:uroporphyrinogen-III C-methyltransferase [Castellaniella denitrificans]|uniref:Uroporphyrinogen-III C-methyltransferase n=1 Tax=Castellaniella denitrificans TaxID=56119 RepID=A0ABT4M847_9BURK|nr:uroporphyrinogen-III C-methyltransferase [Castellaniella denitrificans]MCZ4331175.1 uroporphyrinogen-III C-methyltransferase [Castellaniella denitrificans]
MTDTDHSSPAPTPESATPASALATAQAGAGRKRLGGAAMAVILLVLLALVLGGALFYQNRQYRALRADLQEQHRQSVQIVQETRDQAGQALAQVQAQAARLKELSDALDTTAGQVQELDQALRMMTDSGSDLLLLNDIDHLVTIAQQQLSLGGNVANAIISLEAAQAQLARANRPGLAALQQSINGDLDRLRAVATIDLPALTARIDRLSDLVGSAPLLIPDAAGQATAPAPTQTPAARARDAAPAPVEPAPEGWRAVAADAWQWTRDAAGMVSQDLRALFDVRRVDDAAALLMSPDQALRFREVLKQRAVTAQLALMMHQSRIWQAELDQLSKAIDQRYDMRAESSREALRIARELRDTAIEVKLPTVDNSLAAIAAARDAAAAQDEQDGAMPEDPAPDDPAPDTPSPDDSGQGDVAPTAPPPVAAPASAGTV